MSKTFGMIGGGGGGIKLASIAIITPPAKTTYTAGETFDPAGMVVEATYSNGAKAVATGYAFTPSTALTDGTTSVTVRYTEGGVTATAEQAITVSKAAGSLSISPTSLTLDNTNPAGEIIVDRTGDGAISVVSSAPDIAEVSVSGNIVTVTGKASGNATITISVAEGTNHTAPASKTCAVTVSFISTTLNDNEWDVISSVSDADEGANYWAIGDRKAVVLDGTVSKLTLSNMTVYPFIIGFNHNASVEGSGRIHFQLAKTALSGGTDICFISGYNDDSDFYMNATNTNSGGWASSQMRTNICGTSLTSYSGTMIAVIPAALRAVLKSVTKYTNNTGKSTAASAVTATTDYFFLLSEYEVFGSCTFANSNEASYQAQYAYYAAGNSKIKCRHNATSTAIDWWLRSPRASASDGFVSVGGAGTDTSYTANYSYGFAPGFCV